jgi:nicotinamidase-related amidase
MPEPERIDRRLAALIAYDVCRRALAPADPVRRAAMRPVLDAWVRMIAAARAAGVPVIYTTPVSRADGADVVLLPTDLSAETGVRPLTNAVEGPTPSRARQRRASLMKSRRGPRITSFSSVGRAHSTGPGSPSSCTCCGATR